MPPNDNLCYCIFLSALLSSDEIGTCKQSKPQRVKILCHPSNPLRDGNERKVLSRLLVLNNLRDVYAVILWSRTLRTISHQEKCFVERAF